MGETVLLLNAAATWYLTGLIWVIQVVHYALFDGIGTEGWRAYHRRHMQGITWIVAPPMLVELVTSIWLVFERPAAIPAWGAWVGLALVVLIWISTFAIQVPMHKRLAEAFDTVLALRLTRSNWVRTLLWSLRGGLMFGLLWSALFRG